MQLRSDANIRWAKGPEEAGHTTPLVTCLRQSDRELEGILVRTENEGRFQLEATLSGKIGTGGAGGVSSGPQAGSVHEKWPA